MSNENDSLNYGYEDNSNDHVGYTPDNYCYEGEPKKHHHSNAYEYPITTTPIESVFGRTGIIEPKSSDYSKYYQLLSTTLSEFAKLILSPNSQGFVTWDGTTLAISSGGQAGTGTVTSVGLSAPSNFTVTGSPITGFGTLSFSWNGPSANFLLADGSTVTTSTYALASSLANYATIASLAAYQPLDADLTAIASLGGLGLLKKTGTNTWELDNTTYLTATSNAATASKLLSPVNINGTSFDGSASISFNTDAVSEGPTNKYFLNSRVLSTPLTGYSLGTNTAISALDTIIQAFGKIQSQINNIQPSNAILQSISNLSQSQTGLIKLTNGVASFDSNVYALTSQLSSYQPLDADLTSIAGLSGNTGILRKTAANTWSLDTAAYLTGNQSITISGDATGTGSTSISLTVGKILGITVPAASTGNLRYNGSALIWDATAYLTGNQSITWTPSGDVSGSASGTTAITPALVVTGIQGKAITLATGFLKYNGTSWSFDNSSYQPLASNLTTLAALGNPSSNGYVLSSNTSGVMSWIPVVGGGGTVTSVGLSAPTLFTVSGSPITTNGTLSFAWNGSNLNFVLADGSTVSTSTYALASALSSYLTTATASSTYLTISTASTTYQPLDGDLTSIAGLSGTSGFAKKTAANTWTLDTNTYLTANQSITWTGSGDVSGTASGATSIAPSITVTGIRGKSITLASGLLRYNGTAFSFDSSSYLTANQSITLSGDVSGSGTTAITVAVNKILGNSIPANATGALTNNGTGTLSWVSYLTTAPTITLTGDVTGSGTGSFATTIASSVITGKLLTGYSVGANTAIAATDSILVAFQKIQGQINNRISLTSLSATSPILYNNSTGVISHASTDGNLHVPATSTTNNGKVLTAGATAGSLSWTTPTTGTVTSVGLTAPSIFTVSGSPVTSSGSLTFAFNGSSANFLLANGSTVATSTYLTVAGAAAAYQPLDADLTSIAGLSGTSGLLRKTAANTWTLDTNTYLTANQTITLSGDVTGSGTTAISTAISAATVTSKLLTGYVLGTSTAIAAADTILAAFGKIQAQINAIGVGSVTSVGLSAPTIFTVSNSPVTGAGTLTFAWNGSSSNLVRADGSTIAASTYQTAATNLSTLAALGNPASNGYVLSSTTAGVMSWIPVSGGGGTVTSIGLSAPSIFTVSGSPVTTTGTLSFAWNGASTNFVLGDGTTTAVSGFLTTSAASSTYQPLDADLTSIAGLAGTTGWLKKTAANTWALDTSTFLTSNQSITWTGSGDISGSASGTTSISPSITVTGIRGKSITLASGLLRYNGTAFSFDSSTYLTANQSITLSGDASGSGTTAITVAVNKILGNTVPANASGALTNNGTGTLSWVSYLTTAPTITLTGDITGSGTGSFATSITAATVTGKALTGYTLGTNAVLAATDTILAAFGKVQAQINAKGTGTITSVALSAPSIFTVSGSPVTSSGTLSFAWNGASSNLVRADGTTVAQSTFLTANQSITLSGDASGSGATSITVAVNKLLGNSIPANAAGALTNNGTGTLSWVSYLTTAPTITLTGDVTGSGTGSFATSITAATVTGKALTGYTLGTNAVLAATDTILAAFGKVQAQINAKGTGTITSVALSAPSIFTVSGSPVTSSGTLSFAWNGASSNLVRADGTTVAQSTFQTANTNLTAIASLPNASGSLTNNGSGTFSYTAMLPLSGGTLTGQLVSTKLGYQVEEASISLQSIKPVIAFKATSNSVDSKIWLIDGSNLDTFQVVSGDDTQVNYLNGISFYRAPASNVLVTKIGHSGGTTTINTIGSGLVSASSGLLSVVSPPGTSGYVLSSTTAGVLSWIAPGSGGMTNPMTTTGDMIYASSGSTPARLAVGTTGQVLIGGTTPTWSSTLTLGGKLTVPASTTGSAGFSLQQGTAPTVPGNGDFWITSAGVYAQVAGSTLKLNSNGALYYSSTTSIYITNTTTAGSLGSTSLASAAMTPGNVISVQADGYVKYNTLSDTVTVTVRIAGTDVSFTVVGSSVPSGVVNTNYHWYINGRLMPSTGPGAGSSLKFFGRFVVVGTGAEYVSDITQTITADTSSAITFDLRAQWSGTGANNSIGSEYLVVQQINSIGGGGGAVMSVALSAPSLFTVTGSPITSSGVLGFAWNGSSSNLVRADGSVVAASSYQAASTALANFAALGNPSTNGYILSSTTGGVYSWIVPPTTGMTNPMTSVGDFISGDTSGAPTRVPIGNDGYMLAVIGGKPAWQSSVYRRSQSPTYTYTAGDLTRIDYGDGSYKVLTYTAGDLTQVDYINTGVTKRKTFAYTSGDLTSITETTI